MNLSAHLVEYADSICTKWSNSPSKCRGYDTKPSDGKAPVLELWGM